jgi:all-trans-8'-apo-beta-carotenal 15,15'-oxygenase
MDKDIARVAKIALPRPTIIHDFIVTKKHAVFFCPPVRLRLGRLLAGIGSFDSNLAWEPQHGTEVIVVPLATPEQPVRFTVPSFFQWHFVNAWEDGDTLVVDYLPYDDFETNDWFGRAPYEPARQPPPSRYARARLDLASRRMSVEVLSEASVDFPAIHPADAGREHEHTWLLDFSNSIPPALCRFDTKTRRLRRVPLGENTFPSEAAVTA